LKESRTTNSNF